jgi:putative PIN family toxin of toxin-antitoxin system
LRAVLDPNVLISALLSPAGTPAALLVRWLAGAFELVVSELLLAELDRAFAYPKLRSRVTGDDAKEFVDLLRRAATMADDPAAPARRSRDPGDDYLLALAAATAAILVTGDQDLLDVKEVPVETPRSFLAKLEQL